MNYLPKHFADADAQLRRRIVRDENRKHLDELGVTVAGDIVTKINLFIEQCGTFGAHDEHSVELFNSILDDYRVSWGTDRDALRDALVEMAEFGESL